MSSLLGHSLTALTVASAGRTNQIGLTRWRSRWLRWLVVLANAPDIDYLLPSAGRIDLFNRYRYRNLLIEVAALGPISVGVGVVRSGGLRNWYGRAVVAGLLLIAISGMAIAAQPDR